VTVVRGPRRLVKKDRLARLNKKGRELEKGLTRPLVRKRQVRLQWLERRKTRELRPINRRSLRRPNISRWAYRPFASKWLSLTGGRSL
jgi:hypothetical protein